MAEKEPSLGCVDNFQTSLDNWAADNRLQVFFGEKPDRDMREEMKGNGLRYASSAEADRAGAAAESSIGSGADERFHAEKPFTKFGKTRAGTAGAACKYLLRMGRAKPQL